MTKSESRHFNWILIQTILIPVILILVLSLIVAYITNALFNVSKSSDISFRTMYQARTCEKDMVDMETGLRGYFLTNDLLFLEPYNKALAKQQEDFELLKDLAKSDSEQTERVDSIIKSKVAWIQDSRHRIEFYTKHIPMSDTFLLKAKAWMDDIRSKFDAFNARQNQLLQKEISRVKLIKNIMSIGSLTLLVFLVLIISYHIWKQLNQLANLHKVALTDIHKKNDDLLHSQNELFQQKEWFRTTLSSIGDAVVVTNQTGQVVFMNPEAERLCGWKSAEALTQPLENIFKIMNEETRLPAENPVEKVRRENKVVGLANHTVLINRETKIECAIEDSAAPIYDQKAVLIGVVLVFHDATEMRSKQRNLREHSELLETLISERTEKLQKALTEMETFSYTVSHDLRSPLRAMQGYAEAVLEDFGEKLNDDGRRYLNRIKNAAERLDRLIQDLLTYTRIFRDDTELVPINLHNLVQDIILQYSNLHESEAEICIEGVLPTVAGRESAFVQIFSNLLGNAVKFINNNARPYVKVYSEEKGDNVRIWVVDNGIGIDEANHERIFKMFEQVQNSVLYEGTGVGLAIVKKAVENMQGKVGLESSPGQGSKFWVEFRILKSNEIIG